MAPGATEHDRPARERVLLVYLQNGIAGFIVVVGFTFLRAHETGAIIDRLGRGAPILISLFFLFSVSLALLLFPLTKEISVSLVITAFIAMFPLLGAVISAWIAVIATMTQRILSMAGLGPSKIAADDRFEWVRTFALFGTYGIPVIAATLGYEAMGGPIPLMQPSLAAVGRIAAMGGVLILLNNLIVSRVQHAWGYPVSTIFRLDLVDSSIYILTMPYAIQATFSYGSFGWGGVASAAFTGVLVNAVGRKLALMRSDREQLIQRLASLTNVGKSISISDTTDDLLQVVYTECSKVIDVSFFSIALFESSTNDLSFELSYEQGRPMPKVRLPVGDGLNSWVVMHGKPLLIGSSREEEKLGVTSIDDGVHTESWLGVPMTARHHVLGVISVQSYAKDAFREDDLVLMTAIANQAAVAVENAHLYKDLEGLNLALEFRVAERTNELREANLQLIAADRSKNQFLASMSHELRTPLNAIIGFSQILLDATRGILQPRLFKFLENIRTAGGHLLDLINDILDLAKIESGKLQLRFEHFDLRETVATVERVIKGMAAERHISVITQIEEPIGGVRLDEGRIKQILLNLLSNAVKFSDHSGFVYLKVKSVNAAQSPLAKDSIRIDVTDAGMGIPSDEMGRIFDEFYQVSAEGRPHRAGTGLGLSLTKNFVEMHGGKIGVASEPGKGATFTIHLPRDAQPVPERRSPETDQRPAPEV